MLGLEFIFLLFFVPTIFCSIFVALKEPIIANPAYQSKTTKKSAWK